MYADTGIFISSPGAVDDSPVRMATDQERMRVRDMILARFDDAEAESLLDALGVGA